MTKQRVLLAGLAATSLGGGVLGWFLIPGEDVPRIFRAMAGAFVANFIVGYTLSLWKAYQGLRGRLRPPPLDLDWRETDRRTRAETRKAREMLARRAAPISAILGAAIGLGFAMDGEVVLAIWEGALFAVVTYVTLRWLGRRQPLDHPDQPR